MRVNVYIDGFNLYYRALKGTPYKWLDLAAMCRALLPRDQLHRIRYFTARISGRPDDPGAPTRQDTYLRALATLPEVTVHLGQFMESVVRMRLANPPAAGPRTVEVIKTEEKGSDVNLATYLLADAFRGDCELAAVVTNDSDLCEPIRIVKDELGIPVGLLNPARRASAELMRLRPLFTKQIRGGVLAKSQLPQTLRDGYGEIRKPSRW